MEENEFVNFLLSKKINANQFEIQEKETFQKLAKEFSQMSSKSFQAQKLFLINHWRRKYPIGSC